MIQRYRLTYTLFSLNFQEQHLIAFRMNTYFSCFCSWANTYIVSGKYFLEPRLLKFHMRDENNACNLENVQRK